MASFFIDSLALEREKEQSFLQARKERIVKVREQELALAKKTLAENLKKQEENRKKQEEIEKFNEYQAKLKQIEELASLKQQNLQEIGLAQKQAEAKKEEQMRELKKKEERNKRFKEKSEIRQKEALDFFNREQDEKNNEKMQVLRVKREIKDQENLLAHQKAKEYREKIKDEPEKKEMEFFEVKLEKNLAKTKKRLDFKHTHFHNPMIQKHSLEDQMENAMDLANREYEKTMQELKEKAKNREKSREKAKERGSFALKAKKTREQTDNFEKNLEKIEILENKRKVEEERKILVPVVEKTNKNITCEKRGEKELEAAFIDKFAKKKGMVPQKPKPFLKRASSSRILRKKQQEKQGNTSLNIRDSVGKFFSPLRRSNTFLDKSFEKSIKMGNFLRESPEKIDVSKENTNLYNEDADRINNEYHDSSNNKHDNNSVENIVNNSSSNEKQAYSAEKSPEEHYSPHDSLLPKIQRKLNQKQLENSLSSENSPNKEAIEKSNENSSEINQNQDIQTYIREQEEYLAKLESDRRRLKQRLENENKQENRSRFEETAALIQNLHQKEHGFNDNEWNEHTQQKADNLIEKFLGSEPRKSTGVSHSRKRDHPQNTPLSDLSYSISQDATPEKTFERSLIKSHSNNETFDWKFDKSIRSPFNETLNKSIKSPNEKLEKKAISKKKSPQKQEKNSNFNRENFENTAKESNNEEFLSLEKQINQDKKTIISNENKIEPKFEVLDDETQEQGQSLAEIFKRKKAKMLEKLESKKQETQEKAASSEYKARTKEEILRLRKEMMKKPEFLNKKSNETAVEKKEDRQKNTTNEPIDKKTELMQRLAMGVKPKVEKEEYKALTSKNYEKLPEVLKKKKEEEKRMEFRKRQEKQKMLDQRLRESLLKK